MAKSPKPPKRGTPAVPKLTVEATIDILRTTVPRLEELTAGVPRDRLHAVTGYGWSVNDQLAHLRACHDVLGGNMLRIVREDHPSWNAMSPRTWQERTDYFSWDFGPAFTAFRKQRSELLEVLDGLPAAAWERTAMVTAPPNTRYEYSVLFYGDWMARHERGHLGHMARILAEVG